MRPEPDSVAQFPPSGKILSLDSAEGSPAATVCGPRVIDRDIDFDCNAAKLSCMLATATVTGMKVSREGRAVFPLDMDSGSWRKSDVRQERPVADLDTLINEGQ